VASLTTVQNAIPIAIPSISDRDVDAVTSAVRSGWISGRGKYVTIFEQEFGSWLDSKHVISCNSGTAALHLALVAAGIGPGDDVIIPALSMGAVSFAVAYTGAKIVLAESETDTWNMDTSKIEDKISPRTKAIIAMHTYGHPVDLNPLKELCDSKSINLVEDAAEAHGAEHQGRKVGTIGNIGCFSFFANKIITTGEGGAVTTDDPVLADRCRVLRDMAFSKDLAKKFLHEQIGFN
jgi:perosamine synthetase